MTSHYKASALSRSYLIIKCFVLCGHTGPGVSVRIFDHYRHYPPNDTNPQHYRPSRPSPRQETGPRDGFWLGAPFLSGAHDKVSDERILITRVSCSSPV